MANTDFINILQQIRGTGAPGDVPTDGIWYELITADTNGNPGIYGDILAKYGLINDAIPYVDIIAAIESEIAALGPIATEIQAVDAIKTEVVDVASEPLRQSILDAESNADTASSKATEAQLKVWEAEAEKMTADSYATEPEDVLVKLWSSNGDGTFSSVNSTEYSSLHHSAKASIAASGDAVNISYDNTASGMGADDVQDAVDELDSRLDTAESKLSGVEAGATADQNANEVPYNNTDSGLVATDVKAALDELDSDITNLNSLSISYDNTLSGMSATNVKEALDEIENNKIDSADYATSLVGGTLKARLNGTILYLTSDGTDA